MILIWYPFVMPIEWNKVTWYSKLLAVILFLIVLCLGFYFGLTYQKIQSSFKVVDESQLLQKVQTGAVTKTPVDISNLEFTPQEAIKAADAYVVSKVGEGYFKKYFTLDIVKTEKRNKERTQQLAEYKYPLGYMDSYYVVYINKELVQVGAGNEESSVSFGEKFQVTGHSGFNDCINKPQLCQFNITKDEALSMAQKNGFDSSARVVYEMSLGEKSPTGEGWIWAIEQKNASSTERCGEISSYYLDINISTGKIGPRSGMPVPCD